jgi:hypothetical protein
VEAIEIAGFKLVAVVPSGYANSCLSCFAEEPFSAAVRAEMAEMELLLKTYPSRTVSRFWREVDTGRRKGRLRDVYALR